MYTTVESSSSTSTEIITTSTSLPLIVSL
jgi:hypothetical protein